MNELKLGHRVIAWDDDVNNYIKGRFIITDGLNYKHPYFILTDCGDRNWFSHCELDPNATEFLTGDEVEFSDDGVFWVKGIYGHRDISNDYHREYDGLYWDYCRYPKKEEEVNINVNQKTPKGEAIDYLKDLTPEELAEIINEATNQ